MFCDIADKATKLAYGMQSSSRTASWDAMEFAFRIVREVKKTGIPQRIRFQLNKGLRPSMLEHAANVVQGVDVTFAEPEPGVFLALIAKS